VLDAVEGTVAVLAVGRTLESLRDLTSAEGRVAVLDPLSAKGLEFDATVVVDPDEIVATTAGGVRTLYVALTRAAHRMSVVSPAVSGA
jgi:ATP-dependent exoDNAse (exonuclease V) beta subunit